MEWDLSSDSISISPGPGVGLSLSLEVKWLQPLWKNCAIQEPDVWPGPSWGQVNYKFLHGPFNASLGLCLLGLSGASWPLPLCPFSLPLFLLYLLDHTMAGYTKATNSKLYVAESGCLSQNTMALTTANTNYKLYLITVMWPVIFGFQKWRWVACFCSWWWHQLGFQISSAHRCAWRPASQVTASEREIGEGGEEVQLLG